MSELETVHAPACRLCTRRHEVRTGLQCRYLPPRQDVGQYAVYPTVRPDDFCHVGFELDEVALPAKVLAAREDLFTPVEPASPPTRARRARPEGGDA